MTKSPPVRRAATLLLALLTALAVLAVPPAAAQEDTDVPVDRVFGEDRVATSIAVSTEVFPDGADAVVVARPDVYADALAAGPLAAAVGGPILLAGDTDDLEAGVAGEIDRLAPTTVYIAGGEQAVSAEVESALAADYTVERLAGADRFVTAQQIIARLEAVADIDTVVVTKGVDADDPEQGFADAMSASWWAGQQGYAIAPVRTDSVPAGHVEALEEAGVTDAYVVGGPAAVSPDVEAALGEGGAGLNVVARLGGANRYETSAIVWDTGVAQGANPVQRWTARGDVFADALSSGPAVAAAGYTFVLVHPTDLGRSLPAVEVISNSPEYLERVVVLGGENAVSADVATQLASAANDETTLSDADYCLTVLHNNDGESQLISSPSGEALGGVARFASVVEREQQLADAGFAGDLCAERASVLLNSGDNFLAGAEYEASVDAGFTPFYDAAALNAIGYDAFTIGNHEFDFGPDVLDTFISQVDAPFVSINLVTAGTVLDGDVQDSVVITKGSRTIGIIGASPTNLAQISSPGEVGVLSFDDTVAAVNAEAERLRTEDGVDIVVFQSHLQNIDRDLELIAATTGVDIAIAGGGDEQLGAYGNLWLPEEGYTALPPLYGSDMDAVSGSYPVLANDADGRTVPIVTTTGDYEYLGRLRARFDADSGYLGNDPRRSRLVRVVAEGYGPDGVAPDAQIQTDVVDPVAAFVATFTEQVIGTTEVPLDGRRSEVRTRQTNVGSLLTDSYIYAAEQEGFTAAPNVALANGGGIRNDSVIPTGSLTVGDAIDIAPFGNTVVTFTDVTAEQLKAILERGYSGLPDVEGRYSQVGGITVEVDTSQTAQVVDDTGAITTPGERVRSVAIEGGAQLIADGQVVDGAPTVNLSTANFTAQGGDNYPFADVGLTDFSQVSPDYRLALQTFIQDGLGGTVAAADYPQDPDTVTITGG